MEAERRCLAADALAGALRAEAAEAVEGWAAERAALTAALEAAESRALEAEAVRPYIQAAGGDHVGWGG